MNINVVEILILIILSISCLQARGFTPSQDLIKDYQNKYLNSSIPSIEELNRTSWSCSKIDIDNKENDFLDIKHALYFVKVKTGKLYNIGEFWKFNRDFSFEITSSGMEFPSDYESNSPLFPTDGDYEHYIFRKTKEDKLLVEVVYGLAGKKDEFKSISHPDLKLTSYLNCNKESKSPPLRSIKEIRNRFLNAHIPTTKELSSGKNWNCKSYSPIGEVYRLKLIDEVMINEQQTSAFSFEVPKCWGIDNCSKIIKNSGKYSAVTMIPLGGVHESNKYIDFQINDLGLFSKGHPSITSKEISLTIRFENQSTFIYEDSIRMTNPYWPETRGLTSLTFPESSWVGANYGICHLVAPIPFDTEQ